MRIITVSKTESTNALLKDLHKSEGFPEPVCLVAKEQTAGRGQQGAQWQSEALKNLTFSVLFPNLNLKIEEQFKLNMLVSICIQEILQDLDIPNPSIKWPNDIMADSHKIGGVLIENAILKSTLKNSIVGIGLNVNQTRFNNLPQASSLKLKTDKDFDMSKLLGMFTARFKDLLTELHSNTFQAIQNKYESQLFKKNKISVFKDAEGYIFQGIIKGINQSGQLQVETEDQLKSFGLKEIKMLF